MRALAPDRYRLRYDFNVLVRKASLSDARILALTNALLKGQPVQVAAAAPI